MNQETDPQQTSHLSAPQSWTSQPGQAVLQKQLPFILWGLPRTLLWTGSHLSGAESYGSSNFTCAPTTSQVFNTETWSQPCRPQPLRAVSRRMEISQHLTRYTPPTTPSKKSGFKSSETQNPHFPEEEINVFTNILQ